MEANIVAMIILGVIALAVVGLMAWCIKTDDPSNDRASIGMILIFVIVILVIFIAALVGGV